MGKIKINGIAKKKFKADVMKVDISVSTAGETSASAINKGKRETEKILQLLVGMGIELAKVSMKSDKVTEPSRYHDDNLFHFTKNISFTSNADLALLEALSAGIIKQEINATYTESFSLSNIQQAENEVLQEALLNAKKKAEEIAGALGQKVIGIEEARCDEYEDDTAEEKVDKMYNAKSITVSLATQLSPDTVSVDRSINVTWIIE